MNPAYNPPVSAWKLFKWDLLHPLARVAFKSLAADLSEAFQRQETPVLFLPFEGYRSPEAQAKRFAAGTSKARPWQSAHQFGLAVDFVPWIDGGWSWAQNAPWHDLDRLAKARGLLHPIAWDMPHVEFPHWRAVKDALAPSISGSAA